MICRQDSLIKMGGLNNKWVVRILTWMESFLYEKADQIIVLTEHQRKFIADKGFDPDKIRLIPNGIVVGSWEPDPSKRTEFRRRMGVKEDEFVAIYTGAHGAGKCTATCGGSRPLFKTGGFHRFDRRRPEKEKLLRLKEEEGLDNVHLLDPVPKSRSLTIPRRLTAESFLWLTTRFSVAPGPTNCLTTH